MIGVPPEMKDFAIWLNPRILAAFDPMEVLKLARACWKHESHRLDPTIQKTLSEGLANKKEDLGQFALRVYFYQLLLDQIVSLDLRSKNFHWTGDSWQFRGVRVAHHFSNDLRQALFETYQVFYNTPGKSLLPHLERMKLLSPDWTLETKKEFEELFWQHFSKGSEGVMIFEVQDLLRSFSKIFAFVVQKKAKLPAEFSMLGLYLSSLYIHLSELETECNVRLAFDCVQSLSPTPGASH